MNDVIIKDNFENMIYEIRGVEVMLYSDLAKIYECANGTKTINQSVKRNIKKFPSDFYFQLTESEYYNLMSQIGTSRLNNYGGVRKMPFAFTEQGVAMLATVIHTKVAADVSVNIMRAFVKMRHFINNNNIYESLNRINNKLVDILGSSLNNLGEKITTIVKIKENNVKEVLLNNIDKIINN